MGSRSRARAEATREDAQAPDVARLQLAAGAVGLTVATLGEAEVFASAGREDLFELAGPTGMVTATSLVSDAVDTHLMNRMDDARTASGAPTGAASRSTDRSPRTGSPVPREL